MTEVIEKMPLTSLDIQKDQLAKLKAIFPEVFNEDKVDWERLQLTLGEAIDTNDERFGMTWPGKSECFKVIQQPSIGTLKPCKEESVNWDSTENLFIEGDNLEVLKLLQQAYYGKVKMIYIDPPYNTGKEFIYPDNYTENLQTYLAYSGQLDEKGLKFSTNAETDGRYHSKWMNMMYPRLFLARNLLRDDGLIFLSIDDHEYENLKKICDEIYGEDNHVNTLVWKKRYNAAKEKHLAVIHDYILIYSKNINQIEEFTVPGDVEYFNKYFTERDEYYDTRGGFMTQPLEAGNTMDERANLRFPINAPDGSEIWPRRQWVWGKDKVENALREGRLKIYKGKDETWKVRHKQYEKDENGEQRRVKPFTVYDKVFTQDGTKEFVEIFGNSNIFPFPKPSALISHLIEIANCDSGDIVLDFFSGSAPTAQAVLSLNKGIKFIMVQLPEPCDINSEAYSEGFLTISSIGRERVRRVLNEEKDGFRAFKLVSSNFKVWDSSVSEDGALEKQLQVHIDHINPGSTDEDVLYEILLKAGYPLTTKIETLTLADKTVYSIDDDTLLICLDRQLTKEVITEMAKREPQRVVCLDTGFENNDQLKTNAVQIMKSHQVKDFQTV